MSNGTAVCSTHERLSALADGELERDAVAAACSTWRDDAASRAQWHAYHLIGDVLRSEDLASSHSADSPFLSALRVRLAAEPVVLAPMSLAPVTTLPASLATSAPSFAEAVDSGTRRRVGDDGKSRWRWMAPSAVAAGFVLVAGALTVIGPTFSTQNAVTASTTTPSDGTQGTPAQVAMLPGAAAPALTVSDRSPDVRYVPASNRQLIRDARLDRYLSAHKEFAGSTALGVPSGFLRDAVAEAPVR